MATPSKFIVMPRRVGRSVTAALSLVAFPGLGFGQDDDLEKDEVYELSPFVVDASGDQGYRATNTTSGTSLNTAIKDLPMAIEVINEDFLNDTSATNLEEALKYSSGVFLDEFTQGDGQGSDGVNAPGANVIESADRSPSSRAGVGGRFDNAISIRGFNVPFQNRDGFRYGGLIAQYGVVLGGIIDTSNVERMEVVRGPNSLLYGIGVLSGIVNVVPNRPLSEEVAEISIGAGSNGYFRTTFDYTSPIAKDLWGGELSYRVAGAIEERDSWTDWRGKELEYYTAQLQFRNEKWNTLLEYQYADVKELGIGAQHIHDNLNAAVDQNFRNEFGEQFNWTKDYGGLPESYRITGPDTYHWRRESNIMANVDFTPIRNLTVSAGLFLTDAEEQEFNINLSTLTNSERSFDLKGVLLARPNDPNTENPEEVTAWINENVSEFPLDIEQQPGDLRDLTDYRFLRYWWTKDPSTTVTEQYRLRAVYELDSRVFGSEARHRFLVGRHDIKDEADFGTGNERIDWQFANKGEIDTNDPLVARNIFDHSVIRYNGELLAQPNRLYLHNEVWFTGHYGLYQGTYLNDRLSIIAGARHDRYHARDRLYDRFDELAEFGPDYDGPALQIAPSSGIQNNPDNLTFGFFPLPEGVSEYIPDPEKAESEVTKTIALNYKLTDNVTLYGLRSEGLTPNTGARDGNLEGIDSERSVSEEIGVKFDLMEGKLSGTVSAYRITRENAIWNLTSAPSPVTWVGGVVHPTDETDEDRGFEPDKVASGEIPLSYGLDRFYFDEDGVELGKVRQIIYDDAGNPIGRRVAFPDGLMGIEGQRSGTTNPRNIVYLQYDKLDEPAIDSDGNETGHPWRYYIEKAFADVGRSSSDFRAQSGPDDFDPMFYQRTRGTSLGLNSSLTNATGANVTYDDEATGLDLQLIYAPNPNWQILFTYAHTEREAISPFQLVDVVDPESGVSFGTEYDVWVRTFGREAFGLEEVDSDGDGVVDQVLRGGQSLSMGDVSPLDLIGGLQGVSLFTGSEDAASLWTKYDFDEGMFKNLQLGMGGRYIGSAETSIPIGGDELAANLFRTPATKERYIFDAFLKYKWEWNDINWSAQLNIYNLTDDQKGQTIAVYDDQGQTVRRRTDVYYTPRSFRLSLSMLF